MTRQHITVAVLALCLAAIGCGNDLSASGSTTSAATTTAAPRTTLAPPTTATPTTAPPATAAPTTRAPSPTTASPSGVSNAEWIAAITASYGCVPQPPRAGSDPSIAQITACDLPTGGQIGYFEVADAEAFIQWSAEVPKVTRREGYWMVSPTLAVVCTEPTPQMVSDFDTLDTISGV